ncbi:MAG: hypothetical protein JNG90_04760, partial [Planctomycetaceae bacterium]|nr:hypothetical protein [Planctomycetaceae bacterium]
LHGGELWLTDGTAAGTRMVKDLNPGEGTTFIQSLVALDDELFFVANDGTSGWELWKTNGTAAGTLCLSDPSGAPGDTITSALYVAGDFVYFLHDDGIHGAELWRTDGTPTGFQFLADLVPGPNSTELFSPVALGDKLVFGADAGNGNVEIWKSDGSPAGTERILELSSTENYAVSNLAHLNGRAYFLAQFASGTELWSTDGSAAGTSETALPTSLGASTPTALESVGEQLLLTAQDPLWRLHVWQSSDPGTGWTSIEPVGANWTEVYDFLQIGPTTYFVATNATYGTEIWKTDGTAGGTSILKNIRAGSANALPRELVSFGGQLYFLAHDGYDRYLWRSDGTEAGTVLVTGPDGYGLSARTSMAATADRLYFDAAMNPLGIELWTLSSPAATPEFVKDINRTNLPDVNASISDFLEVKGIVYFIATDGVENNRQLWRTDGTDLGTYRLGDVALANNIYLADLVEMDGVVYFAGYSSDATGLWRSDGTQAGTYLVKPFAVGAPYQLVAVGQTLYFSVETPTNRRELWMSDGSAAGTTLLHTVVEPVSKYPLSHLFAGSDLLYFVVGVSSGLQGTGQLWRTDGTSAGTFMLMEAIRWTSAPPNFELANLGDITYFAATAAGSGSELWRTDGTVAGTYLVSDSRPGPAGGPPTGITNINGVLYYITEDNNVAKLWRNDGTADGTSFVAVLPNSATGFPRARFYNAGERFFLFLNQDLYASDGTEAGTVKLLSGLEWNFHAVGHQGSLYFSAADPVHGQELWTSDGTSAGTHLVADFMPGSGNGQYPYNFPGIAVGDMIYFQNRDPYYGYDLWLLDRRTPGDATNDGIVDGADYTVWADNYQQPPNTSLAFSEGDFNRDGVIDGADYTLWADHYSPALSSAATQPAAAAAGLELVAAVDRAHADELSQSAVTMDRADLAALLAQLDGELLGWVARLACPTEPPPARPPKLGPG